jgi:hypothetical protein
LLLGVLVVVEQVVVGDAEHAEQQCGGDAGAVLAGGAVEHHRVVRGVGSEPDDLRERRPSELEHGHVQVGHLSGAELADVTGEDPLEQRRVVAVLADGVAKVAELGVSWQAARCFEDVAVVAEVAHQPDPES